MKPHHNDTTGARGSAKHPIPNPQPRRCRVCGGPLRSDNRTGICHTNPACRKAAGDKFRAQCKKAGRTQQQGVGYRGQKVWPIKLDQGAVVLELRQVDGAWYQGDVRRNCGCELVTIRETGRCTAVAVYPSPAKYSLASRRSGQASPRGARAGEIIVSCSKCGKKWGTLLQKRSAA